MSENVCPNPAKWSGFAIYEIPQKMERKEDVSNGSLGSGDRLSKRVPGHAKEAVITAGEVFPDCAMIELVSSSAGGTRPHLLLWNKGQATISPQVQYCGVTYEAQELASNIYRAIHLPSGCENYGSVRQLFSQIAASFAHRLGFAEPESQLLASFSMSTWLADRLPMAPTLIISSVSDEGLGFEVLKLLSCFCRHPLMLAEVTPAGFRSLPMHLTLTLLVNQQELRPKMQRLFRASSYRGLHLLGNQGTVVDLFGSKACLCGGDAVADPLNDGLMKISMTPSQERWQVLDEHAQAKLGNEFQPRLLLYRLKNCANVSKSRVELVEFTTSTRQLVRAVAGCFVEDPKLASDTVRLLRPQDEDVRERRRLDVNCIVIEVLWGLVHHGTQKYVPVDELATKVNVLLRARGEALAYSAVEIGWKLRAHGITRHTRTAGRQILLDRETRLRVHSLSHGYDLLCSQRTESACPECGAKGAAHSE